MNLQLTMPAGQCWSRIRGMFNLNDPRWGRGDDSRPTMTPDGGRPTTTAASEPAASTTTVRGQGPTRGRPTSTNSGATSTASSAACSAAAAAAARQRRRLGGGGGGGFQPDMKSAGVGVGLIAGGRGADLAGHRLLHRAGRPAGRHHAVRQLQDHRGRRLQLAPAVPDPAPRAGGRDADPLGRRRPRQRSSRPPACASRPC